jgi:phosphopantothenoylcysteine decarboxylase / phosphopantothenate---cysteine ligase
MGDTIKKALTGKYVVYGITGGIAAYKAPFVVRGLSLLGADVDCIMTESAHKFVTPLALQSLSKRPVYTRMFPEDHQQGYEIEHIALADKADLFIIAPATANFIAKMSGGIADDLLSSTVLATKAPVLVCPAMNVNMLENRATQDNLEVLAKRGIHILEPEKGLLACGWEAKGRMPDPERIVLEAGKIMLPDDLKGVSVLLTCGPTCEDIDPVRFITNRSSGKMGAAIAEEACLRGADVTVVTGPVNLSYAPWAKVIHVRSAAEMLTAVKDHLEDADVLIMAAAVADYTPKMVNPSKIKKGDEALACLELTSTSDILYTLKPLKKNRIFVGFAAETDDITANAASKMKRKSLDMIVANRVGVEGSGFASDTNTGVILLPDMEEPFEAIKKTELAGRILDLIKERL